MRRSACRSRFLGGAAAGLDAQTERNQTAPDQRAALRDTLPDGLRVVRRYFAPSVSQPYRLVAPPRLRHAHAGGLVCVAASLDASLRELYAAKRKRYGTRLLALASLNGAINRHIC